jgi:flagellar biosynthesis/type III secretory pathway protein FliH
MILYLLMYHRRAQDEGARLGERLERALEEREGATGIVETVASTLIDRGKRIGIEEGKREGEREGERRGIQQMARLVVEQKFGVLRPASVRKLTAMSLAQLKALVRVVPEAHSLEDLGL